MSVINQTEMFLWPVTTFTRKLCLIYWNMFQTEDTLPPAWNQYTTDTPREIHSESKSLISADRKEKTRLGSLYSVSFVTPPPSH